MVLRLRLARIRTPGGSKTHAPTYNIVLAQARSARDSKPMEVLGTYDPIPKTPVGAEPGQKQVKDIKVDVARAKYWLGVGAQPSHTVWRLLSMIGLLEPRYLPTGEHNAQALKAVRFPTQTPKPSTSKRSSSRRRSEREDGVDALGRVDMITDSTPSVQDTVKTNLGAADEMEAEQSLDGISETEPSVGDIHDNETTEKTSIGAENTSPMDPNAV